MKSLFFVLILFISAACKAQPEKSGQVESRLVGGPCEVCDAIEGYNAKTLQPVDTLPDFADSDEKLKITGTIYQVDGKTPAKDVILYIYQTDEKGVYQRKALPEVPGKEYTYHQGWVKTGADGKYSFYTFVPGAYPNGREAKHIHPLIKEPDGKVYYIDTFFFDKDPLLSDKIRANRENRGGSGILHLEKNGDIYVARKDITLGLNIPAYE